MPAGRAVRVVHTSDLHVSTDAGPVAGLAAMSAGADAVLVAGDLFESNRVAREVVERTFDLLASLGPPVVVLPGNHDCLDDTSVYRRHTPPPNVHVLSDPDGERVALPGLVVWGRPCVVHEPSFRPLDGLPPRTRDARHVVLAHGDVRDEHTGPYVYPSSSPIFPAQLEACDWDYVALGHHHVAREVAPRAWYCGDGLVVTLDGDGVRVEPPRRIA